MTVPRVSAITRVDCTGFAWSRHRVRVVCGHIYSHHFFYDYLLLNSAILSSVYEPHLSWYYSIRYHDHVDPVPCKRGLTVTDKEKSILLGF